MVNDDEFEKELYGKSSSTNKAIYRVHSPAYFNNDVTYTEHNGNLYYFTRDNTLAWMKRYIYTLYKYSFSDGTTEKVAEFEPIANQLMFSNGQIFEETENGFNIYSLSGKHLRSIVIENAAELPKFKSRYDTDKYGENKYGVENDKGIHESFNGNIYCIINSNQLIELSPLDQ